MDCPVPLRHDHVQLAHGGGGRLMQELIEGVFLPAFGEPTTRHDSAVLATASGRIAMTTDGYVVRPRFFAGGDIGSLAVFGTVNDLAMAGATPRWLSAAFVLEEGLAIAELRRICASMAEAAERCGVTIVTGDTKVVDRGKGDGVFIVTTGIGELPPNLPIVAPAEVRPEDAVLISGDVGRHGMAVMSAREGLGFEASLESDCGPLHEVVAALLEAGLPIHCLRDLTRGGLASALNEIARDGGVDVVVDEAAVGVCDAVRGACEILGLDPFYVACEGRMVAFVPAAQAEEALAVLRAHRSDAACIGRVRARHGDRPGRVSVRGALGAERSLDLLSGEQLPRIC
jgi:hydrogenase expression/formation protein HypE